MCECKPLRRLMKAARAPRWREATTQLLTCVLQMVGLVYMVGVPPWAGRACGVAGGLCVCLWRRARRDGGGLSGGGVAGACVHGRTAAVLRSTHAAATPYPGRACVYAVFFGRNNYIVTTASHLIDTPHSS